MSSKKWPDCQVCGKQVYTKDGFLVVYEEEIIRFEDEQQKWDKEHPEDVDGGYTISSADLMSMPDPAEWHWGHDRCLDNGSYEIPYSRFNTTTKALSWTLHLMEKNWFNSTNWRRAVRAHHKIPHA